MKGGQMVTHPCAPLPRIEFFIQSLPPSPEPDTFVSVVVCVARKPLPCPSYSRRRDCNNCVHWHSLYKGGGGVMWVWYTKMRASATVLGLTFVKRTPWSRYVVIQLQGVR